MFSTMDIDGQEYQLRPMNCPFHILIYKSRLRSYRELPMRWAELGADYRYEKSGVLHGLLRVRGFTMDDAHLFVRPDQLGHEIRKLVRPYLAPPARIRETLASAGAYVSYADLGVTPEVFRGVLALAMCARSRYTVLDAAFSAGLLEGWVDDVIERP
jgi:hypothetical protein